MSLEINISVSEYRRPTAVLSSPDEHSWTWQNTPAQTGEPEQALTPKSGRLLYKALPETGQGLQETQPHFWSHPEEEVMEMAASTETQAQLRGK